MWAPRTLSLLGLAGQENLAVSRSDARVARAKTRSQSQTLAYLACLTVENSIVRRTLPVNSLLLIDSQNYVLVLVGKTFCVFTAEAPKRIDSFFLRQPSKKA